MWAGHEVVSLLAAWRVSIGELRPARPGRERNNQPSWRVIDQISRHRRLQIDLSLVDKLESSVAVNCLVMDPSRTLVSAALESFHSILESPQTFLVTACPGSPTSAEPLNKPSA